MSKETEYLSIDDAYNAAKKLCGETKKVAFKYMGAEFIVQPVRLGRKVHDLQAEITKLREALTEIDFYSEHSAISNAPYESLRGCLVSVNKIALRALNQPGDSHEE